MFSRLDAFREYLAAKGKRLTSEREIIAKTIFSLSAPFTGESVVAAIEEHGISRVTVYRTLTDLTDSGQIRLESTLNSEPHYYHSYQLPKTTNSLTDLCASKHASLIAGKCPWCGRGIINGEPYDD